MKKLFLSTAIIAGLLSYSSCVKREIDTSNVMVDQWDPEFALALADLTVSVEDISLDRTLEDEIIEFAQENYPDFDYTKYQDFDIDIFPQVVDAQDIDFWVETPITITEVPELDKIRRVEFKIRVENSLPFDSQVQMFFVDEEINKVDSLFTFDREIVESSQVIFVNDGADGYYEANGTSTTIINTTFERNRKQHLLDTDRIILHIKGRRPGSTNFVNVFEGDKVRFKISARFVDIILDEEL